MAACLYIAVVKAWVISSMTYPLGNRVVQLRATLILNSSFEQFSWTCNVKSCHWQSVVLAKVLLKFSLNKIT